MTGGRNRKRKRTDYVEESTSDGSLIDATRVPNKRADVDANNQDVVEENNDTSASSSLLSSQVSNGNSKGTLIGVRVLKEFPYDRPVGKKTVEIDALFLGTVVDYEPCAIDEDVENTKKKKMKKRKTTLGSGLYRVQFDDGDVEDMTPDEVYECAMLYHEQRELRLTEQQQQGNESTNTKKKKGKKRSSSSFRPIVGINEDQGQSRTPKGKKSSIKKKANEDMGLKSLLSHTNKALSKDDIAALESERMEYWLEYEGYNESNGIPKPTSIFEDIEHSDTKKGNDRRYCWWTIHAANSAETSAELTTVIDSSVTATKGATILKTPTSTQELVSLNVTKDKSQLTQVERQAGSKKPTRNRKIVYDLANQDAEVQGNTISHASKEVSAEVQKDEAQIIDKDVMSGSAAALVTGDPGEVENDHVKDKVEVLPSDISGTTNHQSESSLPDIRRFTPSTPIDSQGDENVPSNGERDKTLPDILKNSNSNGSTNSVEGGISKTKTINIEAMSKPLGTKDNSDYSVHLAPSKGKTATETKQRTTATGETTVSTAAIVEESSAASTRKKREEVKVDTASECKKELPIKHINDETPEVVESSPLKLKRKKSDEHDIPPDDALIKTTKAAEEEAMKSNEIGTNAAALKNENGPSRRLRENGSVVEVVGKPNERGVHMLPHETISSSELPVPEKVAVEDVKKREDSATESEDESNVLGSKGRKKGVKAKRMKSKEPPKKRLLSNRKRKNQRASEETISKDEPSEQKKSKELSSNGLENVNVDAQVNFPNRNFSSVKVSTNVATETSEEVDSATEKRRQRKEKILRKRQLRSVPENKRDHSGQKNAERMAAEKAKSSMPFEKAEKIENKQNVFSVSSKSIESVLPTLGKPQEELNGKEYSALPPGFGNSVDTLEFNANPLFSDSLHSDRKSDGIAFEDRVFGHQGANSYGVPMDTAVEGRTFGLIQCGHPSSKDIVEGVKTFSRRVLFASGAHKNDLSPINGNHNDGCDSILLHKQEDCMVKAKDDISFFKFTCTHRTGSGALFQSFTRDLPVRVFRKAYGATETSGGGAIGYRYDGLYSVIALFDETGKPRIALPNTTAEFLFKRRPGGKEAKDPSSSEAFNALGIDELWNETQPKIDGQEDEPEELQFPMISDSVNPFLDSVLPTVSDPYPSTIITAQGSDSANESDENMYLMNAEDLGSSLKQSRRQSSAVATEEQ